MKTLVELKDALHNHEVTPEELVKASIAQIELMNPSVNAVVYKRYDEALKESRTINYENTVYGGIPILIKNIGQDLMGLPSTCSSKLLVNNVATHTDRFVQKLQDLGFIILGQTNAPEYAFKNTTDSVMYGDAVLPQHPEHSSGGSSGGAAAALASGMVSVVSASDGGGSIRIPASYAGLVGLKPTRGSMPVGPNGFRGWQGAAINFFLTQTVADTVSLFHAMKENQDASPFQYIEDTTVKPTLRIAYTLKSPVGTEISEDARLAVLNTVQILRDLGHEVVEDMPVIDGFTLMKGYYIVNAVETAAMFQKIEASLNRKVTPDDVELVTWALYRYGLDIKGYEVVNALNQWDQASAVMQHFHEQYDLYLTPTTAYTAPKVTDVYQDAIIKERIRNIHLEEDTYLLIWDMFEKSLARTPFAMLANMTGQPAISLPMYRNNEGFNLGIQLTAPKGHEAQLFAISRELESYFIR